ncbi:MAG: hypothetical protein ACLRZH_16680 [Ruthenibacterium lactatiformans]
MEYILRVAVHEDAWRRQLGELLELCARTPIREVMLMEESHQLLTSPFPREKHERMAAVYARMAEAFAAAGVRYSVNLVTCAARRQPCARSPCASLPALCGGGPCARARSILHRR